jgi:hypothetical protein
MVNPNSKFATKLHTAELKALASSTPNPMAEDPSPSITKATTKKTKTYEMLTSLAQLQRDEGLRTNTFKFLPLIFSHSGEFSPSVFNWMTAVMKRQVVDGLPPSDGLSAQYVAARYRTLLKDGLACAIAKGFGNMLRSAGLPRPERRR